MKLAPPIDHSELELYDDQSYWYKDKPFTGLAKHYRDDGSLESEVSYEDGVQEGVYRDWNTQGKLVEEGYIHLGTFHGKVSKWFDNGQLKSVEIYKFGICVETTEWNEQGLELAHSELASDDPKWETILIREESDITPGTVEFRKQPKKVP